MATGSYRREIEARIPVLRQCARALVSGRDQADELVHDVLIDTLSAERTWSGEDVAIRLFSRLVGVNRSRTRSDVVEHRYPARSATATPGRPATSASGPAEAAPHTLLVGLTLGEREALVLVVLGGLDYPAAAQALGIPVGALVTRVTQARDRLGHGPLAARGTVARKRQGRAAPYLQLVKS